MKVCLFAFFCVAAVIRLVESSDETNEESKHDRDLERALDAEPRYGTNGCDCAKEAILAIHEAHQDVLEHVPLSMLGLLDANRDSIWGPGGWDPKDDYKKASTNIKELVMHATKCLKEIICGTCDDDRSSSGAEQVGGDGRIIGGSISLFECCCDAGYIRQMTISYLKALKEVATLNPGGSSFTCIALDSILHTAKHTIDELARRHKPACTTDKRDQLGIPDAGFGIPCIRNDNPFCKGPIPGGPDSNGLLWFTLPDESGSVCLDCNPCPCNLSIECPNGQSDCPEGHICVKTACEIFGGYDDMCYPIPGYFPGPVSSAVEIEGAEGPNGAGI